MRFSQRPVNILVAVAVLSAALTFSFRSLSADTVPGRAEVRTVKGNATYSTNGGPAKPLRAGMILRSGSTIRTGSNSMVDLFLGVSAGVVRVAENSIVAFDKLTLTDTGTDTAVEVQLHVSEGEMYFKVNKLSKASRYEIKMPTGVAGIRGTKGCLSFRQAGSRKPPITLLEGRLVYIHVPPGGEPVEHTLNAPPAVYFSPVVGVQEAPEDLVNEVSTEVDAAAKKAPVPFPPPTQNKQQPEPFVSPNRTGG
jgi:FecR protein